MAKIDFLMPKISQYNALHNFTIRCYEAFQRKGHACRLIAPDDYFAIPVEDPPDMTFGLNGAPFNGAREMLSDIIEKPHFAYLIDPPYRFFEILKSPYLYVGCDDRYGCTFLKEAGFNRSSFLPHGVDKNLAPGDEGERDIDLLFLATYIDYEKLREEWLGYLPKVVSLAMDDAIDIVFSDDSTSFMRAFPLAYMDRLGLAKEPERVGEDFILPLILLERYIKGKERADLVRSIKKAPLLLFNGHAKGEPGWESLLGDRYPNITLHHAVTYDEGLSFMKRAKIVINCFSKNKEGAHDRLFNGMARGALLLSNDNTFTKEFFRDGESLLLYRPNDLSALDERLISYLQNEPLRREIAERGRKEAMARHTWDCRIESLNPLWDSLLQ